MRRSQVWVLYRNFAVLAALLLGLAGGYTIYLQFGRSGPASTSGQTDVDRAEHLVDSDGVPYLKIEGIGQQRHPAWIAIYALAYAGEEVYDPRLANLKDDSKFAASIKWLEQNLKPQANGLRVWEYGFDNTYNDISITAPWSSAFAQATGIQAFLAAYKHKHDPKYLELARKAAQSLFIPLKDGGFLFQSGSDIWFEEIPQPANNPGHILNGHMRVLLALKELADATGDPQVQDWLERGTDTLYRWLPRFDTGYWLRYDLNPQKNDLLFRFANPYGFANHPLAIDKITLRDPVSKEEVSVDLGAQGDAEGASRMAGTHWGQVEQLAGRTARRLVAAEIENKPDEMAAPHSYFYLSLPGQWRNNVRDQWYELIVDYYDDAAANITMQQRSIAPGLTFRDMRDGDLHLTGAKQWRRWIVPVRPSDLGYWVGQSYAEKHAAYLSKIAQWDERFHAWGKTASGYAQLGLGQNANGKEVKPENLPLPHQTPMLPLYSLGKDGVLRQYISNADSRFGLPGNQYKPNGEPGYPVESPFNIARQLIDGADFFPIADTGVPKSGVDRKLVRREPALRWLLNSNHYREVDAASIYTYPFNNTYNDIFSAAPWASAFGQAYVLKALIYASEKGIGKTVALSPAIEKAARAFSVPVQAGGIMAADRNGMSWYEEVPNATHVLNAHLVSVPELTHASRYLKSPEIQSLSDAGISALREHLHQFDTGYWLRYDQNPKKELLFQIDWLSGDKAPLIDEVLLQNPQTGHFVRVDIGTALDGGGGSRISGSEWLADQTIDGKTVRSFSNGYTLRKEPAQGGTRHNAYLNLSLPDRNFGDFFDVPAHRLIIRYKDAAQGQYVIKAQSINEGSHLTFVPLRGGTWSTKGDGKWKEASFIVRPQDMGWYKGPVYQVYEVAQIQRIADLTKDWFFEQYAIRHRYFLKMQRSSDPIIQGELILPLLEQQTLGLLDREAAA